MIASLHGTVIAQDSTGVVIEVGGVGMRVFCPAPVLAELSVGQTVRLHTSLVVREDSLTLFGFSTPTQRDAFELVQSASGIGPKTALGVLSVLTVEDFVGAVRAENLLTLTKVPGIGKKGAQKLVIELKDKVLQLGVAESTTGAGHIPAPWQEQVVEGLQSLGWTASDAVSATEAIADDVAAHPEWAVGQILRAALASLARA
jgi:Holliday junction DNA helicase RuvA